MRSAIGSPTPFECIPAKKNSMLKWLLLLRNKNLQFFNMSVVGLKQGCQLPVLFNDNNFSSVKRGDFDFYLLFLETNYSAQLISLNCMSMFRSYVPVYVLNRKISFYL